MVGGAQVSVCVAGALRAQLDVVAGVSGIHFDLFHSARGEEGPGSRNEWNPAGVCEPRRNAHHVLFGDAHVDGAVRVGLLEWGQF